MISKIKPRRKPRRVSVARDRAYLSFLKSEGRCFIGILAGGCEGPLDPAHGPVNGISSKGADDQCIPLCRKHHNEQHRLGWVNFQLKYGFIRDKEVTVWQALYAIWKEHQGWPSPVN